MLELKNVDAGYGTFQALFGATLEVRLGEAVGVIGPNGAGKTTLMRVISGLIRPRGGQISVVLPAPISPPCPRTASWNSASPMCRNTAACFRA